MKHTIWLLWPLSVLVAVGIGIWMGIGLGRAAASNSQNEYVRRYVWDLAGASAGEDERTKALFIAAGNLAAAMSDRNRYEDAAVEFREKVAALRPR